MKLRSRATLALILLSVLAIFIIVALLIPQKETRQYADGAMISWDEVGEVLRSGEVRTVVQTHSQDTFITLKNGGQIKTRSPRIDMIFDEIRACGYRCRNIIQGTE